MGSHPPPAGIPTYHTGMPILVVFLLTAACLPVDWPAPPFGLGPGGGAALTAAVLLLPLAAAAGLRTCVVRAVVADPARAYAVGRTYARGRRLLVFANLGAMAAALALGWGWVVRHTLRVEVRGEPMLAPLAELAVPLPYFLLLFAGWLLHYDADRALDRAAGRRPIWSRGGFFLYNLRRLGLVLIPVGLFAAQQSVGRFFPDTAGDPLYRAAAFAGMLGLAVFAPLLLRPLLGFRRLPAGPARDRVERLAARLGFGYADLLVWPTRGSAVNALITGLVPRARYVVFTDRLLDDLPADEVDAVFGHEVGHARHGHVWYYALFGVLSMAALTVGLMLLARGLTAAVRRDPEAAYAKFLTEDAAGWLAVVPAVLAAGYVFVMFGLLSRRCERQADIAGCRAVSCGNPACGGHDDGTVYPPGGGGLCPTGVRTFVRALERVAYLNGYEAPGGRVRGVFGWVRAWQHGTLAARVNFLLSLLADPGRARRFERRLLALRVGLVAALATALLLLGTEVGWGNVLAEL